MPFGKWKGVRIRLLPDDYLSWLTTTDLIKAPKWKWLRDSLISELEFRGMNVQNWTTPDPKPAIQEKVFKGRKFRFDE